MTVIGGYTDNAAVKIFQIYYFVGFPLGFITYVVACWVWPPPGLGEKVLMGEDRLDEVIEGEGVDVLQEGKDVVVMEKQKGESGSF